MDKKNMTEEELQRTQVLNLDAFKEVARFEKMTSKKPAIFIAVLGIFSIALGTAFPAIQSYAARKAVEATKPTVQSRVKSKKEIINRVVEKDLICKWENLNLSNGTDETINVTYHFKDDALIAMDKVYSLTKSKTATSDPEELKSFQNALQPFLIQTDGYALIIKPLEENGIEVTTKVDYELLDISTIPAMHQENYRFNVIYQKGEKEINVRQTTTEKGYVCE